jgi:hypothetical protein
MDVFSIRLSRPDRDKDIVVKETLAVLETVRPWHARLHGRQVMFCVDNLALL